MFLRKITNYSILAFLFLLPWQTRWIYSLGQLNGLPWEYGTLSFYGVEILLWLIVILTGFRLFGQKDFWRELFNRESLSARWKNLVAAVVFICAVVFFTVSSPVRDVSIQFLSRLIGGICLAVSLAVAELPFSKMASAFWAGGVIQGLLGAWQFFTQKVFACKWLGLALQNPRELGVSVVQFADQRWLRAYGSFGWPNSLGVYLAVIFVLGLWLYVSVKPRLRIFLLLGQPIVLLGLLLSFSRGAWLAAAIGTAVFIILFWRGVVGLARREFLKRLAEQFFIVVLLSGLVIGVYWPVFSARFNQNNFYEQLSTSERIDQSVIAREIIFQRSLFGVGPGLYTYYIAGHYPAPSYGQYQPVHNIYILALAETGVFVFLCLGVWVLWLLRQIWRRYPPALALAVVLLVAGLFDHFLWSLWAGQALFWAVFGLILNKKAAVDKLGAASLDKPVF